MRRYQKWLSLGLMALTPGVTLAGALDSPQLRQATTANPDMAARKQASSPNQKLADKVAGALRKAKLTGFDIDIGVDHGVAILEGSVSTPEQRATAAKVAMVPGIHRVDNRLQVIELPPKMNDDSAMASRRAGGRAPVRAANYQGPDAVPNGAPAPGMPAPGMVPGAMGPGAMGPGAMGPGAMGPGAMGVPPAGMPAYGQPIGNGSHMLYNQPGFPNYAWPAYAQYPNSAMANYPTQYSASAWPYIGPFYPYPQVPLGWRKAQLEWDDGYWQLNFRPRTDRWWWFLDPTNW
jgi:hypothetical protein